MTRFRRPINPNRANNNPQRSVSGEQGDEVSQPLPLPNKPSHLPVRMERNARREPSPTPRSTGSDMIKLAFIIFVIGGAVNKYLLKKPTATSGSAPRAATAQQHVPTLEEDMEQYRAHLQRQGLNEDHIQYALSRWLANRKMRALRSAGE